MCSMMSVLVPAIVIFPLTVVKLVFDTNAQSYPPLRVTVPVPVKERSSTKLAVFTWITSPFAAESMAAWIVPKGIPPIFIVPGEHDDVMNDKSLPYALPEALEPTAR